MAKQEQVIIRHEVIDPEKRHLHEWRVAQLVRLGITESLAEVNADNVDWHQIARLVGCGCPPLLALRIVRLSGVARHGVRREPAERPLTSSARPTGARRSAARGSLTCFKGWP